MNKVTAPLKIFLCLVSLAVLPACTIGSKLKAKHSEVVQLNQDIEARAYRCAGKELALAKAHAEFGLYELQMGDWPRANEHLEVAYENSNQADILSRKAECREVVTIGDKDQDTILDNVDACPESPEDFDGFEDSDGCPEDQDTDGDGIADSKDLCPTEPGLPENQGCPQVVQDKDGDGIQDAVDKCPLDPEDFDGFEDEEGCPDYDNDQDKIPDVSDKCPTEPEDIDQFEDEEGCPDYDNDKDQILDVNDSCPNEPEDYDGDNDEDGCPDTYELIVVKDDRIEIKQKVLFASGRSVIRSASYGLLNEVADVLRNSKDMSIRIEGHTDSIGNDRSNERLSQKRADAVRKYLIGQGINPARLTPVGFGESRPLESNSNPQGRDANRRVEFHIVSK